jgi:hypothetical protein
LKDEISRGTRSFAGAQDDKPFVKSEWNINVDGGRDPSLALRMTKWKRMTTGALLMTRWKE